MKPAEERLELVTAFASLRAGMLVVGACFCGARHRLWLRRLDADGDWECWDNPHSELATSYVVAPHDVARRLVFRVVDGLGAAADEGEAARRGPLYVQMVGRVERAP